MTSTRLLLKLVGAACIIPWWVRSTKITVDVWFDSNQQSLGSTGYMRMTTPVSIMGSSGEIPSISFTLPAGVIARGSYVAPSLCLSVFNHTNMVVVSACESLEESTLLLDMVSSSYSGSKPYPLVFTLGDKLVMTFETFHAKQQVEMRVCCFNSETVPTGKTSIEAEIVPLSVSSRHARRLAGPPAPPNWYQLRLQFDPPTSNSLTTVSFVIELTGTVASGSQLVISLSSLTCSENQVLFTVTNGYTAIFLDQASWSSSLEKLTFQFAATLPAATALTLTLLTPFQLPSSSALNSPIYTAKIVSNTNVVTVPETSFFQSDQVYASVVFVYSSLQVLDSPPIISSSESPSQSVLDELAMTGGNIIRDVELVFAADRPLLAGQTIVLLLPGYQARVREIPIQGSLATSVSQHEAIFDASSTLATMSLTVPVFFDGSGTDTVNVIFPNLTIPLAQYLNDPSLKLGITEFADQDVSTATLSPITISPEINVLGVGKSFNVSLISFGPDIGPGNATSIELTIQPTIPFFEQSVFKVYLPGGFSRNSSLGGTSVVLQGGDSVLFDETAEWDELTSSLTLTLGSEAVITSTKNTSIQIGLSQGFTLPPALSENDKSLKIEAVSKSIITLESIKHSSAFGPTKGFMVSPRSSVLFSAAPKPRSLTNITVSMYFNCEILDYSIVTIHLGGIASNLDKDMIEEWKAAGEPAASTPTRVVQFDATLSSNVVISNNEGVWDVFGQSLTFEILSGNNPAVAIGTKLEFTIPTSEQFLTPWTLAQDDESIWLIIPESGVVEQQFFQVSPVINLGTPKTFQSSQIVYGTVGRPLPPIPSTPMSITLIFWPTFDIYPGSRLVWYLPGFLYPFDFSQVFISELKPSFGEPESALNLPINGTSYRAFECNGSFFLGEWDNTTSTLSFLVRNGSLISQKEPTRIWIQTGFIIPESKLINDVSLEIELTENQILPRRQIINSPAIVTREFSFSSISFDPQVPLDPTTIEVNLVPSVDIANGTVITLGLPGFIAPSLYSPDRDTANDFVLLPPIDCFSVLYNSVSIIDCFGTWNSFEGKIYVKIFSPIEIDETLRIRINETVGFVFPTYIDSPAVGGLTVAAIDSIPPSAFTSAPLVATGPFYGQLYCVTANQLNGVRVHFNNEAAVPIRPRQCEINKCTASQWIKDPCSTSELERCGCSSIQAPPDGSLEINGYNLTSNDTVFFVPENSDCKDRLSDIRIQIMGLPSTTEGYTGIASVDGHSLHVKNIRGITTGIFNICYYKSGASEPAIIGKIFVRKDCQSPLVYYEGACDLGCPFGFVPRNGACTPVSHSLVTIPNHDTPRAITLTLIYPNADSLGLSSLPSSDPTFIFFQYLMTQNLQEITSETDENRFVISSITTGLEPRSVIPQGMRQRDTICVTIIITSSTMSSPRSASELALLINQLSVDIQSSIYRNAFLETIIPQYSRIASPIPVVFCEATGTYLAVCPLSISPVPTNARDVPSWFYTAAILSGVLGGFGVALLLMGFYRIDTVRKLLGSRKSANNNIYNRKILESLERDNDFSIIRLGKVDGGPDTQNPPPTTVIKPVDGSPPTSPTTRLYKEIEELDPYAQAAFAKDWLEGRLIDVSVFLNPKRRIKPPELNPPDR